MSFRIDQLREDLAFNRKQLGLLNENLVPIVNRIRLIQIELEEAIGMAEFDV